jgi:putative transposase
MKRSRYTEEQIIGIVKEQEAGTPVVELCRKHGIGLTPVSWRDES